MSETTPERLPPITGVASLHPSLRALAIVLVAVEAVLSGAAFAGIGFRRDAFALLAMDPELRNPLTLVAHAGMHVGPWHVLINLVPLILFGDAVSVRWGIWAMWAITVAATLAGGLAFLAIGPDALLAGASGAAYGIAGAAIVLWPRLPWTYRLLLLLLLATIPWHVLTGSPVAWQAHAGAMVTGAILGMISERIAIRA